MSTRTLRKIVHIDEEKCDGCGQCVPVCEEGAIQIIDGTAKLVDERYCDGLGDCLGECPQGAITLETRAAEEFDEQAVADHLASMETSGDDHAGHGEGAHSCPHSQAMSLSPCSSEEAEVAGKIESRLGNWPVQLALVPPTAPWLENADLLVAADCTPVALGGFHTDLLAGKKLIIACPKLDDRQRHLAKLTEILEKADIASITVARMEVPCCSGLTAMLEQAISDSGADLSLQEVVVSIDGQLVKGEPAREAV